MKLYDHQQKIIDDDPKKCGLWLGTGSGKTAIALLLARGKTLVICPKTQKEDKNWERQRENMTRSQINFVLVVVSKEEFRRDWESLALVSWDTVIVDEAETCLGATPNIKWVKKIAHVKASQLFEALQSFLASIKPSRLYLCTATITRSPMTVWAAGVLLGRDWDFDTWRRTFYVRLPMPGREVWVLKHDNETKDKLAKYVRSIGYVGRLEDYFDVPPQTYKTMHVELNDAQKKRMKELAIEYPDPLVLVGKKHQVENGVLNGNEFEAGELFANAKLDKILDLALEFPKIIIFAKYRNQIEQIQSALTKQKYFTWTLTGDTKDRGAVIAQANSCPDGIFIAQAQISAGWELPTFPVMVFASISYSITDRIQAEGRIHRANHLKKNLYITLVARGGVDEAVFKSIENKKDFSERIYLNL